VNAKTNAERQKTWREKQAAERKLAKAAGLAEVRGIYAHPEDHPEVKAAAAKIARRRAKKEKA
jgi:hypothetical protein